MARRQCTEVPLLDCSQSWSPLSAGMLGRLLAGEDPLPHAFTAPCVQLCGHMTVMCSSFSSKADFLLLLQSLNTLEQSVASGSDRVCVEEVALRCVDWLHCLDCYIHRYLLHGSCDQARESCDQAREIIAWLRIIADHLEPLQDLLIANQLKSCDCHVTVVSLHVHWTAVSVMYRLAPLVGWTWFLEQARRTLSSLLSHSASLSPCPTLPGCHCCTQLWLLLRHTLDHTSATTGNTATSFWAVVSSLISEAQQSPSHNSSGTALISPSNTLIFSWQSVEQLALLYGFSEEGVRGTGQEMVPHWDLIHHLLPLTFTPGCSERQLRCVLRVCVSLCRLWPPSSSSLPVLSAWDYFHKHMDDPFVDTARSISEWATPECSSPQQWLHYLLSLFHSTASQPRPLDDEANSFQLFLCLIHVTIATDSEGKTWRHLKGRFYSKLHRRWLCERKGVGLHRVVSLMLTLAWTGDTQEVAVKAVSLLGQMGLGEVREETPTLWRGVFAMLLLLVEKRERLDDVINKLQPSFTSLARPHPPESCDYHMKAVCVVLDGTVEVIETANGLSLGCGALIGSHLTDLLTPTDGGHMTGHMTRVLSCVESLISALPPSPHTASSLPPSPHTTSACRLLWRHCSQPLLALTHLPLPPSSLPSTLAALTALTCHHQHIITSPPTSMFDELTKDRVHSMLASSYLSHVIESDVIRHHILTTEHAQLLALHVWFRCLAELDHTPSTTPTSHTTTIQQLTDQLHKLPLVTTLLGNQNTTPTDPLSMFRQLLEAMETSQKEGGVEWRLRLGTVLGDLPHYLESSVSGNRGLPALRHAYHVAGLVVAEAPRLLYSKTDSRCLLPRLVDWLVLPLPSSRKPQVQGVAAATRSHLHLFLSGLLQLDPARDTFIHRKVKQLFSRYFHDSCQPPSPLLLSSSSSLNPFLLALRPWFQLGYHGDGEELRLVMDVIVCQYLSLPQQPASLAPTLQFIKKVVESVQDVLLLATLTPVLLGHMISCLLACDVCSATSEPPAVRRLVMNILTPLIEACKRNQDALPWSSLLPLLSEFVTFNLSVDQVLLVQPLLTVGRMSPQLLDQLTTLLDSNTDHRIQSLSHTLQTKLALQTS